MLPAPPQRAVKKPRLTAEAVFDNFFQDFKVSSQNEVIYQTYDPSDMNIILVFLPGQFLYLSYVVATACIVIDSGNSNFPFHLIMVALCNREDHYIFCPVISFYLLFSSPNLSGHMLDVYHTLTHGVALVRIQNAGLKGAACGSLQMQDPKKSPKIAIQAPSHNFVELYLRN